MSVKLLVLIVAAVVIAATASPAKKSNYIEQENSCRQVCGLCDCDGFYCEDECICECNLEENENLQCIADMKKECDANGLEYELLMQESAKERFLRDINNNSLDINKQLVILKQKRQSASTTTEPTVGAAAPAPASTPTDKDDPSVGAAPNSPDPQVGNPNPLTTFVNSLNLRTGGGSGLAGIGTSGLIGGGGSGLAGGGGSGLAAGGWPGLAGVGGLSLAGAGGRSSMANIDAPKLLVVLRERMAEIRAPNLVGAPAPVSPAITTAAPGNQFSLPSLPPFDFKNFAPRSSGNPVVQPSWLN